MKRTLIAALAALLVLALAVPAFAYTLNADGTGFVGKGEVQTAFGWNNRQLQNNQEGVSFEAVVISESETTWTCTNSNNEMVRERERTTTTTTTGVLDELARVKNQVTGFNLLGFESSTEASVTEGPRPGTCPSGPWMFNDDVETSDPQIVSSELFAVFNGDRVLLP